VKYFGVAGVYAIVHVASGRAYVGSAVSMGHRWHVHQRRLRNGTHNRKLQNAWNKYGEDAFEFRVLEVSAVTDLLVREQAYMDRLDAVDAGYNVRRVAESNLGLVMPAEVRAKMSAARKGYRHTPEARANMSRVRYRGGRKPKERKGYPDKKGQPLSPANAAAINATRRANARVTPELVETLKARYVPRCFKNGTAALAREFGLSQPYVSMILNKQRFK
jgi:group I intron endonuclease